MTRRTNESRRYVADQLLGVSVSLRLLLEGLQRSLSREAVDVELKARLRPIYTTMEAMAKDLGSLARQVSGREDTSDGLRDTRVGP